MIDSRLSHSELLRFFASVPLFHGLEKSTLLSLCQVCQIRRVSKGHVFFRRGDSAEFMYLIYAGSVTEFASGPNELELVVKVRRSGDYFGEMGMLIDEPHLVTSIATHSHTTVVIIPRSEFLYRVRTEEKIMKHLFKTLAERLKRSSERLIAHTYMDANSYLAYSLLRQEKEEGNQGFVKVSQEFLAQRCGLARQTVARILGEWRRDGWISTGRGKIEIKNRTALNELVLDAVIEGS